MVCVRRGSCFETAAILVSYDERNLGRAPILQRGGMGREDTGRHILHGTYRSFELLFSFCWLRLKGTCSSLVVQKATSLGGSLQFRWLTTVLRG